MANSVDPDQTAPLLRHTCPYLRRIQSFVSDSNFLADVAMFWQTLYGFHVLNQSLF